MRSAVLSFSGGLDSATVLAWLIREGFTKVHCVNFQYGSKHNMYEQKAADAVLQYYASAVSCDLSYEVVDLSRAFAGMESSLLLSGGEIPEGHYESSNMSQTVVPARNLVFLSILAGMAWSKGIENIAIGIHRGDHAIYPDCRPEFHKAMDTAIYLGTDRNVNILAPFLHTSKSQIVQYGIANNAPYSLTRTCYKNQPNPCGKCGSCYERLEAFAENNLIDPVFYEEGANNG